MAFKFIFILDFDHTLMETNKPYKIFKDVFTKKFNISDKIFDAIYEERLKVDGNYIPMIFLKKIADEIGINFDENFRSLLNEAEIFYDKCKDSIFLDSLDAIKMMKEIGKVAILSEGEATHQLRKIFECGLQKIVDVIHVTEKKSEEDIKEILRKLSFAGEVIVLIGDKPVDIEIFRKFGENFGAKVLAIRLRRLEGKHYKKENTIMPDFEAKNLVEAVDWVKTNGWRS